MFKAGLVDVQLELAPMLKRSKRGDLIVAGFIEGSEIEVVFPGRRQQDTGPLRAAIAHRAAKADVLSDALLSISARGTWRARIIDQNDLRTERVYQFLAAEWQVEDTHLTYGEPPQV